MWLTWHNICGYAIKSLLRLCCVITVVHDLWLCLFWFCGKMKLFTLLVKRFESQLPSFLIFECYFSVTNNLWYWQQTKQCMFDFRVENFYGIFSKCNLNEKYCFFLVLCMRVVFMLLFAYTNFVLIETFSIVAFSAERFK